MAENYHDTGYFIIFHGVLLYSYGFIHAFARDGGPVNLGFHAGTFRGSRG